MQVDDSCFLCRVDLPIIFIPSSLILQAIEPKLSKTVSTQMLVKHKYLLQS